MLLSETDNINYQLIISLSITISTVWIQKVKLSQIITLHQYVTAIRETIRFDQIWTSVVQFNNSPSIVV